MVGEELELWGLQSHPDPRSGLFLEAKIWGLSSRDRQELAPRGPPKVFPLGHEVVFLLRTGELGPSRSCTLGEEPNTLHPTRSSPQARAVWTTIIPLHR